MINSEEFKKLQKHWYDLLKEQGFKDIERMANDDCVLMSSSTACYRHHGDDLLRLAKEEYYTILTHRTEDDSTMYRSHVDKYIMARHAEGALIKEIVHELREAGNGRDRKTVGTTIKRYEKSWGLRRED